MENAGQHCTLVSRMVRRTSRILTTVVVIVFLLQFLRFRSGTNRDAENLPSWSFAFNTIDYVHSSNICLYKKPKIVVLITSHVDHVSARNIIRTSYPKDLFQTFDAQLIFLLAKRKTGDSQVTDEFRQHNDIVQGNFDEDYRNLTFKHFMGLKWVTESCQSVKYVVKKDDDIVVNYYKLFEIIHKYKSNFEIMGHVINDMRAIRNRTNKWYVSHKEYEGETYPSFVSGWLYVATAGAVSRILDHVYLPYFWIDDVYFTGILRAAANIKLTDIKQHFRYEPKNVECCILNRYSCNFMAAPCGTDYDLNRKLNDHLWECRYKRTCILESNKDVSCLSSEKTVFLKGQLLSLEKIPVKV